LLIGSLKVRVGDGAGEPVFAASEEARRDEVRPVAIEVDLARLEQLVAVRVMPCVERSEVHVLVRHLQLVGMPVMGEPSPAAFEDGLAVARHVKGHAEAGHQ
jgi:hypothetical protein